MSVKIITEENEHLCSYDIKKAKDSSDYARIKDALFAEMKKYGAVKELIPDSTVALTVNVPSFRYKLQCDILTLAMENKCLIDAVIK